MLWEDMAGAPPMHRLNALAPRPPAAAGLQPPRRDAAAQRRQGLERSRAAEDLGARRAVSHGPARWLPAVLQGRHARRQRRGRAGAAAGAGLPRRPLRGHAPGHGARGLLHAGGSAPEAQGRGGLPGRRARRRRGCVAPALLRATPARRLTAAAAGGREGIWRRLRLLQRRHRPRCRGSLRHGSGRLPGVRGPHLQLLGVRAQPRRRDGEQLRAAPRLAPPKVSSGGV
mmetsp:Transcript_4452/g.12580  ORF Transcript_4452/g.12580 Transcript_4452/m.12580 type:complete len:228 (-) Transcript_4452:65-748(-)